MNPQDYQVVVRKIAEKFIQSRIRHDRDEKEEREILLNKIRNNPSEVQFHGYMVSAFHAYHTAEQCAVIAVASESQDIDPQSWKNLSPREAVFTMAFELLKTDVWKSVLALLDEDKPQAGESTDKAGEQLTMFKNT